MDCQKQSNGNASWVYYTQPSQTSDVFDVRGGVSILHIRGAFGVARFDNPGNAKALTRGTSDEPAPRFLLLHPSIIRDMAVVTGGRNLCFLFLQM